MAMCSIKWRVMRGCAPRLEDGISSTVVRGKYRAPKGSRRDSGKGMRTGITLASALLAMAHRKRLRPPDVREDRIEARPLGQHAAVGGCKSRRLNAGPLCRASAYLPSALSPCDCTRSLHDTREDGHPLRALCAA